MKIKTVKKMRLDELIKHVWENGISNSTFIGAYGASWTKIFVNHHGVISVNNVSPLSVFKVTIEEELTEETEIHGATFVYYDQLKKEVKTFKYSNEVSPTIEHMIQKRSGTEALALFKGNQLIWTKEHGIPESGVLEVSE